MNYEYQFSKVIRISDVYRKPEAEVLAAVPANKDVVRFGIPENKEQYLAMDCKTILRSAGESDMDEPRLILKSKTKRVLVVELELEANPRVEPLDVNKISQSSADFLLRTYHNSRIETREL